jgi:hypothetical protein
MSKSHTLQLANKGILLVICLFLLGGCATVHPMQQSQIIDT